MALKTLKATNSAVAISIGGHDMTDVLDGVRSVESAPVENETVFSNEASGGANGIGTPIVTYTFTGPAKSGTQASVPFRPLSLFQDVALEIEYDTGCEESCSVNFINADINMPAGLTRRVAGIAQSNGAVTFAWEDGSA